MNKWLIIAFAACMAGLPGQSQNVISNPSASAFVGVFDVMGKPLVDLYKNKVSGSPFFFEQWVKGKVTLQSKKVFKDFDLQFDLLTNQFYFMLGESPYSFTENVKECVIDYQDGEAFKHFLFRSQYPAIGKNTDSSIYLVVEDGAQFQLLKYISKRVEDYYIYGTAVEQKYDEEQALYIYAAASRQMFLIDKKAGYAAMQSNAAINKYMSANAKPKSEDDWQELVRALNAGGK